MGLSRNEVSVHCEACGRASQILQIVAHYYTLYKIYYVYY
jgi:hypothetical protein